MTLRSIIRRRQWLSVLATLCHRVAAFAQSASAQRGHAPRHRRRSERRGHRRRDGHGHRRGAGDTIAASARRCKTVRHRHRDVHRPRAGPLHDPGGVSRIRDAHARRRSGSAAARTDRSAVLRHRSSKRRSPSRRTSRRPPPIGGPSFGTTLTRDEIEALSDDPATLQQQLQDMAGPGAVIRIDGFEGGALPAKAQIRSIRISRDQFAAEYHSAGGVSIEIITQPGLGPIRYFSHLQVARRSLSGRSPFVPVRGPEQNTQLRLRAGRHADQGQELVQSQRLRHQLRTTRRT